MGFGDFLKGAGGGAAAGSAAGPWGAAAGGVIGGVKALLGDRANDRAQRNQAAVDVANSQADHAQNWFAEPDFRHTDTGRFSNANLRRSLGMGGGLSSDLMGLLSPKWERTEFSDLMAKTDPSQFAPQLEQAGGWEKALNFGADVAGTGIQLARDQNMFDQQQEAMKAAYGIGGASGPASAAAAARVPASAGSFDTEFKLPDLGQRRIV